MQNAALPHPGAHAGRPRQQPAAADATAMAGAVIVLPEELSVNPQKARYGQPGACRPGGAAVSRPTLGQVMPILGTRITSVPVRR